MPVCFICFKNILPSIKNVECSTCILFRHKACVSDPAIAVVCPGCGEYWKPTDQGLCTDVLNPMSTPVGGNSLTLSNTLSAESQSAVLSTLKNGFHRKKAPPPNPNEDYSMSTTNVKYMVMPMGSRQGTLLLIDSKGYTYTQKRQSVSALTFVCSSRSIPSKCLARVRQIFLTGQFIPGPQPHNHPGDDNIIDVVAQNSDRVDDDVTTFSEPNRQAILNDPRVALIHVGNKTLYSNTNQKSTPKITSSTSSTESYQEQSTFNDNNSQETLASNQQKLLFEIVPYGSRHGTDLLCDSEGYTYTHKRTTPNTATWICTARIQRCTAKVSQVTGTLMFSRNIQRHNHSPDTKRSVELMCKLQNSDMRFKNSLLAMKDLTDMNLVGETSQLTASPLHTHPQHKTDPYDSMNSTYNSEDEGDSPPPTVVQVLDKGDDSPLNNGHDVDNSSTYLDTSSKASHSRSCSPEAIVKVMDEKENEDEMNGGMDNITADISKGNITTDDAVKQVLHNIKTEHQRFLESNPPILPTWAILPTTPKDVFDKFDKWVPSDLSFHVIEGGTKKGGELLVDSEGYTYPLKRDNKRGKTWVCSARHKKCNAKVSRPMGSPKYLRNQSDHTHKPNPKCSLFIKTCDFLDGEKEGDENSVNENFLKDKTNGRLEECLPHGVKRQLSLSDEEDQDDDNDDEDDEDDEKLLSSFHSVANDLDAVYNNKSVVCSMDGSLPIANDNHLLSRQCSTNSTSVGSDVIQESGVFSHDT